MKSILISLFLLISINVRASEKRIYTKLNSREARVVIATSDIDLVQAASYVDGYENEKFINDMLNDKNSILFKLKSEIEKNPEIGVHLYADKAVVYEKLAEVMAIVQHAGITKLAFVTLEN